MRANAVSAAWLREVRALMATTDDRHVGKIRIRLAGMLERAVPGLSVEPEDLHSQVPIYASERFDCCSWYGDGKLNGRKICFCSWDTMTDIVRQGLDVVTDSPFTDIEVCARG